MKRGESIPSKYPMEVARAVTRAEWLEGIPPVRHIRVPTISREDDVRLLLISIKVLMSWATNHEEKAERNTGLLISL
jgi:hypothetical protein